MKKYLVSLLMLFLSIPSSSQVIMSPVFDLEDYPTIEFGSPILLTGGDTLRIGRGRAMGFPCNVEVVYNTFIKEFRVTHLDLAEEDVIEVFGCYRDELDSYYTLHLGLFLSPTSSLLLFDNGMFRLLIDSEKGVVEFKFQGLEEVEKETQNVLSAYK